MKIRNQDNFVENTEEFPSFSIPVLFTNNLLHLNKNFIKLLLKELKFLLHDHIQQISTQHPHKITSLDMLSDYHLQMEM